MSESDNTSLWIYIVFLVSLALYSKFSPYVILIQNWLRNIQWIKISLIIAIIIIFVYLIYIIVTKFRRRIQDKKNYQSYLGILRKNINNEISKEIPWCNYQDLEFQLENIRNKLKVPEVLKKELQAKINSYLNKWEQQIIKRKNAEEKFRKEQEWKKRQKELKEISVQRKKEELTQELFNFKKKKKSIKALPLNKTYSSSIISEAEFKMQNYLENKQRLKDLHNEAIEYYKENDLDSEPFIRDEEEKKIYASIRENIKKGKLCLQKKIKTEFFGKQLENNFYRAKDLDEETKRRALAQGFRHVRGNELDGHFCGGGFYIKNNNPRESSWHFYMKHLFHELHDNLYLEHIVKDKRVDVALLLPYYKIAIEIESGFNKDDYLMEKLHFLKQNFDETIIVCKRNDLIKYDKFISSSVKVMTPKKAKKFVLEMVSSIEHL